MITNNLLCSLGGSLPDISDAANVSAVTAFWSEWEADGDELSDGKKVVVDAKCKSKSAKLDIVDF